MNDRVISFHSRKPLEETIQAEEAAEALEQEAKSQSDKDSIQAHATAARTLLKLVEEGIVEGIVILGRHKETGLFYTDIVFGPNGCPAEQTYAYVGVLECLKLEMVEVANMAPSLTSDGTILDPEFNPNAVEILQDDEEGPTE